MKGPTKKQTTLLAFIEKFTAEHNFSPSYREIMDAMNLRSVSAVAEHIENCVAAGFLKKTPKSPRSLEVIKTDDAIIAQAGELFRTKIEQLSNNPENKDKINLLEQAAEILQIKL